MKTARNFAFAVLMVAAFGGRPQATPLSCPLTIGDTGDCGDMQSWIYNFTSVLWAEWINEPSCDWRAYPYCPEIGDTCNVYCQDIPWCNTAVGECWQNADEQQTYCDPYDNQQPWQCSCVCSYPQS